MSESHAARMARERAEAINELGATRVRLAVTIAERDAAVARADKAETALHDIICEDGPDDPFGSMLRMAKIARAALGEDA